MSTMQDVQALKIKKAVTILAQRNPCMDEADIKETIYSHVDYANLTVDEIVAETQDLL